MRTTYRLEETLKHRIKRESEILKLYQSGKSRQEILKELYSKIDAKVDLGETPLDIDAE